MFLHIICFDIQRSSNRNDVHAGTVARLLSLAIAAADAATGRSQASDGAKAPLDYRAFEALALTDGCPDL